jgi:translation elongation factor P/translation initiation factor 5A
MKKKAELLKKGETIVIAGKRCVIQAIELSDVGKQGVKKCRIEALTAEGEKLVIVRPSDYPFETVA